MYTCNRCLLYTLSFKFGILHQKTLIVQCLFHPFFFEVSIHCTRIYLYFIIQDLLRCLSRSKLGISRLCYAVHILFLCQFRLLYTYHEKSFYTTLSFKISKFPNWDQNFVPPNSCCLEHVVLLLILIFTYLVKRLSLYLTFQDYTSTS